MNIIILQGMPCLGKTGLCELLEENLHSHKLFAIDVYGEGMWDRYGFDSTEERNKLYELGIQKMFKDIKEAVNSHQYKDIIIEGVFNKKREKYLDRLIYTYKGNVKTLYLYTKDIENHRQIWETRSRDFKRRHPGHGATHYRNGSGNMYVNKYYGIASHGMKTWGDTLSIEVSFNPYTHSISNAELLSFIWN